MDFLVAAVFDSWEYLGFLMNQKIEDHVNVIRKSLQTAGLKVTAGKRGVRARLKNGYFLDIFTLTNRPDHIRARLNIDESDPLRRQAYVESIQNSLVASLEGVARVEAFKLSREAGGVYVYNSVLEPFETDDDAPIEVSADAIEIIEDTDSAGETEADDLAVFELNFDFDETGGSLKTVSSMAEEAIKELETVDAKLLRQTLDRMSLKRSSAIRLAVTRIFRSAADVEELEKSIDSEARKIVSPEDRAELQEVKALSVNGFLNPVVHLLWQKVFSDS